MTIFQGVEQLICPGKHLRFREASLSGNSRRQALALDEIHHQVGISTFLEEIGYPNQMRMAEICQHCRLLLKLLLQLCKSLPVEVRLRRHLLHRAWCV
ncbi:MAG: hypothetical protein BWY63_02879 [Chloroflexi bacterium ADurb.Bin360]|nr:MAG: hypothetical protein BWY63_02879 [Chloroflexi bacterium ADurb.Bin360]